MGTQDSELLEKIRQQFNYGPYPRFPLDASPERDRSLLYIHHIGTPYYLRNQRVIETEGKVILDVGCGTGYKSLALALANPGAKVVGIDLSECSIELARERFKYQNCDRGEFHALPLDQLPRLGIMFDYINCDELLYLLPDPAEALAIMKSVLKPDGIIRSNLHSSLQRVNCFRAQSTFKFLGLMENNPEKMEIDIAIEFMKALKDEVRLKQATWSDADEEDEGYSILMNYLLQGDKGYTIRDLFASLRAARLEFISMVNWRLWDLMDLFKEPDNLPVFLSISLPDATAEEQLHLFELLHPVHRLLDFWCGHLGKSEPFVPTEEWTDCDWHSCIAYLHPQAKVTQFEEELRQCLKGNQVFPIGRLIPIPGNPTIGADVTVAACVFPPLLESPQPFSALLKRWKQLKPLNLETFEPLTDDEALAGLKDSLTSLEELGYLLLERAA